MVDSKAQEEAAAAGLELVEGEKGLLLRIVQVPVSTASDKHGESSRDKGYSGNANRIGDGEEYLCGDFTRMIPRLRKSNLERELLVKAAHLKNFIGTENHSVPVVLDATAGMGEDSLLLAAAGFQIELYEKDPVIAALLADALRRAETVPELAGAASRMHLHKEDSIEALRLISAKRSSGEQNNKTRDFRNESAVSLGIAGPMDGGQDPELLPDIIYLDPMFPERVKSAKVKKKFQLLHYLERPCANEEELLQAAVDAKPQKIIIKRPVKGPYLAGRKPDYSYSGKAVRYDCLINL